MVVEVVAEGEVGSVVLLGEVGTAQVERRWMGWRRQVGLFLVCQ